jgi:2,5-diketo-D-gluconate reductase A
MLSSLLLAGLCRAELPSGYPSVPVRGAAGVVDYPLIGLGSWQYNNSYAEEALVSAFAQGYRHIDTALVYGNHAGVGAGLAKSRLARDQYFITTKVPPGGTPAAAGFPGAGSPVATNAATALRELGVDYVDMMLLHWPSGANGMAGSAAQRVEDWLALEAFAKAGSARAIGISHYCKKHYEEIVAVATLPVALQQDEFHVGMGGATQPQLKNKAANEANGTQFMGFSSLCGPCGNATDPAGEEAGTALISGALVTSIGEKYGKSGAQVALKWVVQQGIPVIPKAHNAAYQKENFELFDWTLSAGDMAALSGAAFPPVSASDGPECDNPAS